MVRAAAARLYSRIAPCPSVHRRSVSTRRAAMPPISVRLSDARKFTVEVELSWTVGQLKAQIAAESDVPPELQRLVYKGQVLADGLTLQHYGACAGGHARACVCVCVRVWVRMCVRVPGGREGGGGGGGGGVVGGAR